MICDNTYLKNIIQYFEMFLWDMKQQNGNYMKFVFSCLYDGAN